MVAQRDALLRAHKHKTSPQFKQELFYLSDECFFQIAFKKRLVLSDAQKFKHVWVADDVLGFGNFVAF